MFGNFGGVELVIIAVVLLILFGGKKLPEFMRGVGDAIKEFRKGIKDKDDKS